jgi:hypothetical protein
MSRRRLPLLSVLLAALSVPTTAAVQETAPQTTPQVQPTPREIELQAEIRELNGALADARTGGIRKLAVNGVVITPEHIRREAIFLVGAKLVTAKKADFFVEEWKQRAIEEGRDPKEFEISEEDIKKELEGQVREFQIKYPGTEWWEAVRGLTGLTREGYMQQRRQTEIFDRVFFPGPADKWPTITKEAIMASSGQAGSGKEFWETIEKSARDESGNPRLLPPLWIQLCRGWVQKQLEQWSDIRYPADGLPPEVCLRVNDRDWQTDEAFEFIRPGLFYQDVERAMTEVIVRAALEQELQNAGAWVSDDEFRKAFDEYRKPYDATPFTTELLATAFRGYPSLEAFRQRWRLMYSFEKMIAKDINDDNLAEHGKRFARFFADGATSVDVIQILARDSQFGGWLPDGFARAKQRADEAFAKLKGGAQFDAILTEYGEYGPNDEEKGRLSMKPLNQIKQYLRESEFMDLLQGYSIASYLFYDAPEGEIVGPLRGPDAYLIARVTARTPARGEPQITDARIRDLVKQDYVLWRFTQWANEIVAKAKIE